MSLGWHCCEHIVIRVTETWGLFPSMSLL
jgi:hypothetical protein